MHVCLLCKQAKSRKERKQSSPNWLMEAAYARLLLLSVYEATAILATLPFIPSMPIKQMLTLTLAGQQRTMHAHI